MAKQKQTPPPGDEPPKKRPPSRDRTRYLAVPVELYDMLAQFADDASDVDTKRSISWAARIALRRFLIAEGYLDAHGRPIKKKDKDAEDDA